jgi:hypothetical protein
LVTSWQTSAEHIGAIPIHPDQRLAERAIQAIGSGPDVTAAAGECRTRNLIDARGQDNTGSQNDDGRQKEESTFHGSLLTAR